MPRLTVVMPVFNHAGYVEQALASLFAQDLSDFLIVAVDDGSSDASLEILDRRRSRIRVIESPHLGPAAARNLALKATDSEYVAFMDADDVCAPQRLSLELRKLESGNFDLVASALAFIDGSGRPLPGRWTCPPHAGRDYWGALIERNWIGTPTVLLRRSVLSVSGMFDERFTHAEDYDLWLRIGRDHAVGYVDETLVQCRRHAANTSNDVEAHRRFEAMALRKADPSMVRGAFGRLYDEPQRRDEAWVWFLLRSGSPLFAGELAEAIVKHPGSHVLHFARGVHLYDSELWEESRAVFSSLSAQDPASMHNLGVLDALCGDAAAAGSHFGKALAARPDYHDACANIAALSRGGGLRLTRRPLREALVPMATCGFSVSTRRN